MMVLLGYCGHRGASGIGGTSGKGVKVAPSSRRSQPRDSAGLSKDAHARVRGGGRWQRALIGIAAVLAVLLVIVLGLAWRLQDNIDALEVDLGDRPDNSATTNPTTNLAPMNILVIGSDTREDLQSVAKGDEDITGARSDTNLLVHLSAARDYAIVVSIPRDSMVEFPRCPTASRTVAGDQTTGTSQATVPAAGGGTSTGAGEDLRQFNAAFEEGGAACTVRLVEKNTDIFVDHFAVVNFEGFTSMVNGLGGVDICVPQAVNDKDSGLNIPAGTSHLDGEEALAFVRTRHGYGNGSDLARIGLQQAFLSALIREATDSRLLLRPDRLVRFLDAATKSLTTDPGLAQISDLATLARQVRSLPPSRIHFVTVPVEPYPGNPNRVQWSDQADDLWQIIRADAYLPGTGPSPSADAPSATAPDSAAPEEDLLNPEQVSVQVVNTTGIDGLGAQAARALEAQGFQTEPPQTVDERIIGVTAHYPVGQLAAGLTVASAFPGATVDVDPSLVGDTVRVRLGVGAPDVVLAPSAEVTELPAQPLTARSAPTGATSAPTDTPTIDSQVASEDDLCSDS